IYGARLSYDMGRNIIERDKHDRNKIVSGEEEWNRLKHLTNIMNADEMALMRFPVSWAILRNRNLICNNSNY
ncbi:MAG: hypothetical protein ACE5HX_13380, partial [bacterium]